MSGDEKPFVPKSALEIQKMKLAKLMENPDKPVIIPESPKEKKAHNAPEFVRNVMGSSAGAGSGEFHVYRHLRRKEYARQKLIEEMSQKEQLDYAYLQRIEANKTKMEEKTAKNRIKRLKRKQRQRMKKKQVKSKTKSEDESSDQESVDSDEEKPIDEKCKSADNDVEKPSNDKCKSADNDVGKIVDENIQEENKSSDSESCDSSKKDTETDVK